MGFVFLAHFIFKNVRAFIYIYEIDTRGRTKYTGMLCIGVIKIKQMPEVTGMECLEDKRPFCVFILITV